MYRQPSTLIVAAISVGVILLASCNTDDATTNPSAEFIAANSDFAGYENWARVVGPLNGPDPAGLLNGGAHEGTNPAVFRDVYVNSPTVSSSNGAYPNGTIFVKRMTDSAGDVVAITAMAKRGASFNSANHGWEWFLLDGATSNIVARSDTLMGGICNACHVASTRGDYVFTR